MVENDFFTGKTIAHSSFSAKFSIAKANGGPILPRIIAHRGASAVAPENTIAAFTEALRVGAEGIEMDIRLAADGVPVVIHDPNLKRTAGKEGKVRRMPSCDLVQCDVGSRFRASRRRDEERQYAGERIPSLEEVLQRLKDYPGLIYLELKCRENELQRLTKSVCSLVADSDLRSQVIIKSFRLTVVPLVKSFCPQIKTAALFAPKISNILRKDRYLVNLAAEIGADEISIYHALASRKLIKRANRRNLPVTIWTTDSARVLRRAINRGISGVITNDPEMMIAKRSEIWAEMAFS